MAVETLGLASDIEEAYLLIVPLFPVAPLLDARKGKSNLHWFQPNSNSKRASGTDPFRPKNIQRV